MSQLSDAEKCAYDDGYEQGKRDAVEHGRWEYEVEREIEPGCAICQVVAKCSECGWEWFSKDGAGNERAVFRASVTNYSTDPTLVDELMLGIAKKLNKYICCPQCGARMMKGAEE